MKMFIKSLLILLYTTTVLFGGVGSFVKPVHAADCTFVVDPDNGKWATQDSSGKYTDASPTTDAAKIADCEKNANDLGSKIMTFVKIISTLVIVFAVGMIVYGGFKYITSQGDPRQAEGAKTQIWYAGVGLFIVLAAFTILQLYVHASGGLH